MGTETITREIADEDYEYYFADADGAHVGFVAVAPKDENGKFDATKIADASDFGDWEEQGCKG